MTTFSALLRGSTWGLIGRRIVSALTGSWLLTIIALAIIGRLAN